MSSSFHLLSDTFMSVNIFLFFRDQHHHLLWERFRSFPSCISNWWERSGREGRASLSVALSYVSCSVCRVCRVCRVTASINIREGERFDESSGREVSPSQLDSPSAHVRSTVSTFSFSLRISAERERATFHRKEWAIETRLLAREQHVERILVSHKWSWKNLKLLTVFWRYKRRNISSHLSLPLSPRDGHDGTVIEEAKESNSLHFLSSETADDKDDNDTTCHLISPISM